MYTFINIIQIYVYIFILHLGIMYMKGSMITIAIFSYLEFIFNI